MNNQPSMSRERFIEEYQTKPLWDVDKPRKRFVEQFALSTPQSPVLEVGCGTGALSIYIGQLGCDVFAIDFAPQAIDSAKKKAIEASSNVSFNLLDVFELAQLEQRFNAIVDSCFFHVLDDYARKKYEMVLSSVSNTGCKLYMLNSAIQEPEPGKPRAITVDDIMETFSQNWELDYVEETCIELTSLPFEMKGIYTILTKKT